MRILAVNQFYAPDLAATSQLLTQLCEDLVAGGDEVTVVASPGSYLGGTRLPSREILRGVEVLRPWASSLGKRSVVHRLGDYLSFFASSAGRLARARRADVMLVLTTPPMIASVAALVATSRRMPLVTWVQDVYPEVAAAFGLFSAASPLYRGLALLGRATHRQATRIVALSEGMADRLQHQGAPAERLRVIPNWADGRQYEPDRAAPSPGAAFRRELGLEGRFVAMYSGNLGVGHDVATLVEAARLLALRAPEVALVFVGEGGRRAEAERLASGLGNVRFAPYQPTERLRESLAAADVHLASLRPGLEGLLVPSKLYGVMAVGRPLFYVGPEACEVSRVVREHDLGWRGEPGDAAALADALARAAGDPAWVARAGARARAAFLAHFDRPLAVAHWRRVLAEAAAAHR
ncbi:MAG: glycosyltransferase family 4 protein [Myxococcales bacterium]|nr:glycosyltransferase family 4 protein [Myxococcales bacterium]